MLVSGEDTAGGRGVVRKTIMVNSAPRRRLSEEWDVVTVGLGKKVLIKAI